MFQTTVYWVPGQLSPPQRVIPNSVGWIGNSGPRIANRKSRTADRESRIANKKEGYLDAQTGADITTVGYCRVSGKGQADDLASQVAYLQKHYPDAEIIKDFGSGINFKRKGLLSLLERVLRGDKLRIIVAHWDRLARFGGEVIQFLVEQNGGEVVVLDETVYSPEAELTADLLAILHVFSCRMYGLQRYRDQIKEDRNLSNSGSESNPP
ncbi:IS607 family transposase [Candidatus Poribacteria bacterium]|nr:MAG: IS607 family transposase [Candidatus Poribacteria bacterium]